MKLCLAPSEFTTYLRNLRELLMAESSLTTPWDVNNGLCTDFAETTEHEVEGAEALEYGNLLLDYSDFTGYKISLDLPPDRPRPDLVDLPCHVFIRWCNRFYDAECIGGVDDPRKLPIYFYNIQANRLKTVAQKLVFKEQARRASVEQDCRR